MKLRWRDAVPANVLVYALATITWCALGDRWGALCGLIAAVLGPAVEAAVAAAGLARYAEDSDALLGVAPWLPALYFAFGVVVALLAEIGSSEYTTSAQRLPNQVGVMSIAGRDTSHHVR